MVSTRHHPRQFPEPTTPATTKSSKSTPAKTRSISTSRSRPTSPTGSSRPTSPTSDTNGEVAVVKRTASRKRKSTTAATGRSYTHVVDRITVLWLFISLPLVIWDTGYVMLRPYSMPGGKLHSPIWTPYALYGTVDYVYGFPAWDKGIGFTAAQALLNIAETLMYGYYLYVLTTKGKAAGWHKFWDKTFWDQKAVVKGDGLALAVVVAFSAAVMTFSKTVLYWANEYFSGFDNIGHNPFGQLLFLWIIPNGAWLVGSGWMIYSLGKDVLDSMNLAGSSGSSKRD